MQLRMRRAAAPARPRRAMVTLRDGRRAFCLKKTEALVLDHQVDSYWLHGIEVAPGDIVFDVGANIGLFSLRALCRQRGVCVYAFEPNAKTFEVLQANQTLWAQPCLRAFPWALSDEDGQAHITAYRHSSTISTLTPEIHENAKLLGASIRGIMKRTPRIYWWDQVFRWFFRLFSNAVARRVERDKVEQLCELRTISTVLREQGIPRIDLLKVDCEGAELKVLQGIALDDWAKVGKVVVEVHDIEGRVETIKAMLQRHGLRQIVVEKEPEFETLPIYMLYARRP